MGVGMGVGVAVEVGVGVGAGEGVGDCVGEGADGGIPLSGRVVTQLFHAAQSSAFMYSYIQMKKP